jgi:hypothetical protein
VSSDRVDRLAVRAAQSAGDPGHGPDDAREFVRFCYRRRRVAWPALYDEMCAVAARGAFRGMGYAELAELGISFCLPDLPRLAALTEQVMLEERATSEPPRVEVKPGSMSLQAVPASS